MGAYALITSTLAGADAGAAHPGPLAAGSRARWTECHGLAFLRVNSWPAIEETLTAMRHHPLSAAAPSRPALALHNVRAASGQIEGAGRLMRGQASRSPKRRSGAEGESARSPAR